MANEGSINSQKPQGYRSHEMINYDGQAFQITGGDGGYYVNSKPNEGAEYTSRNRKKLSILKQYPNGYTIAKTGDGEIYDFIVNEDQQKAIMGKLHFAFPINSSGSYITFRKMNEEENSCAIVSDGEDGLEPGERRPIDDDMWHELMNEVNNRLTMESSLLYDDKAVAYEKNIKFDDNAFQNIHADQSLSNPFLRRTRFFPDRYKESNNVATFYDKNHIDNFDEDSIQGDRSGQGYRILETLDYGLIFDNDNENGVIPITGYRQLLRDRMVCSYKSKSGEDKNMYVSINGKVAEISKEDAEEIIAYDDSYREYMKQELESADIRRDKAVARIRPQFSKEKQS